VRILHKPGASYNFPFYFEKPCISLSEETMNRPVSRTVLDNGLTVVLKEMSHAPVICFMVWYRVGSRNERKGITGISHWVEHLMFGGTQTFAGGEFDRLISREGGHWNAFTWLDYTVYIETVPAEQVDLCLRLESDRMVNTIMGPESVELERSVILSERAMYENEPRFRLNEQLTATAFHAHPYGHEVIGNEVDLRSMTRDDLYGYYRTHYVPNNAVVVAVGDFQSKEMLSRIANFFATIPQGEPVVLATIGEPMQRSERRITVSGPGNTAYLTFAYRAPEAAHPDYLALTLFNAAFTGGSSLGMFAGGGSNRSSRLYKAMVNTELAAGAGGSMAPTMDPFLYTIDVVLRSGRMLPEVEAALDAELERVTSSPITRRELDKALKRAKAQFVMAGESISGQAHLLGLAESTVGDCDWYETILEKLAKIRVDDLERVCQKYLNKKNRTVGWYQPLER
jgi:zinc protease